MADIEKITANNETYNIADAQAREDISELNTKILIKNIGKTTFEGSSVTIEGNSRLSLTIDYPSSITSHSFYFPIGVTAQNGWIQGICYGVSSEAVTVLFHSMYSGNSTITPVVSMVYIDY